MSITKEAIQHLEKTVLLESVNVELNALNTKSPLLVVPAGFEAKNLEDHMANRTSYRFDFSTKSINDFGEYCKEFDKEGAKCFVNSDRMYAKSIFDLGTEALPLHQRHDATLQLDKTAAFKALLKVDGTELNQKTAANFIDDWADNMTIVARTGEAMTASQAAKQLREITIERASNVESNVGDFSESMSAFEKIEAKNQDMIPSTIEFTCQPYHGLSARAFTIRVSILTGGPRPEISFRIIKLEAQEEDMAEEFKEILVGIFAESKLDTFIGQSN